MRVIFMGTPDFSVGTLEALIEAGHEVCLAVTQPDKPKGRGKDAVSAGERGGTFSWNPGISADQGKRSGLCGRTGRI